MPISLEPKTDDSHIEIRKNIIPEWSYKVNDALKCVNGKCHFSDDIGQLMPFVKINMRSDRDMAILMTWYSHFVKAKTPCLLVRVNKHSILYKQRRVLTDRAGGTKFSDKSQFQYK